MKFKICSKFAACSSIWEYILHFYRKLQPSVSHLSVHQCSSAVKMLRPKYLMFLICLEMYHCMINAVNQCPNKTAVVEFNLHCMGFYSERKERRRDIKKRWGYSPHLAWCPSPTQWACRSRPRAEATPEESCRAQSSKRQRQKAVERHNVKTACERKAKRNPRDQRGLKMYIFKTPYGRSWDKLLRI